MWIGALPTHTCVARQREGYPLKCRSRRAAQGPDHPAFDAHVGQRTPRLYPSTPYCPQPPVCRCVCVCMCDPVFVLPRGGRWYAPRGGMLGPLILPSDPPPHLSFLIVYFPFSGPFPPAHVEGDRTPLLCVYATRRCSRHRRAVPTIPTSPCPSPPSHSLTSFLLSGPLPLPLLGPPAGPTAPSPLSACLCPPMRPLCGVRTPCVCAATSQPVSRPGVWG